ncbi:MAG: protein kinase [Acidobacteria bacterium]|nr:protein kinase [Acidobacteriota bacterium]
MNLTVGGRYKLYRRLGQGGLSTVFAATDLQTDNVVVVKVSDPAQLVKRELTYAIDAETAQNYWREMLERMRREAEVLTEIDHPNIVRFFDTGMIGDDLRFAVMEFLRGQTLREKLDAHGKLEVAEAANITLQICDALGEVHTRGIVHRDISPRNVIIVDCGLRIADSDVSKHLQSSINDFQEAFIASQSAIRNPQSAIKLIDFGIAKFPQPPGAPPFTQYSVLSGTVAYASPEQCQSRAVDHRSDIYSLGVMLYEMLTGERPFKGRTPTEIAIYHLQAEPQPPRQLNPEIPVNLEKLLLRALAKSPEDRQQSVQELADELRLAARQVVIPLTADAPTDFQSDEELAELDRLTLVRRRRRRVAVAAAVVLLAVLAGAIFGRNWLASRALPLIEDAKELAAMPSPSPSATVPSDLDSLELAAQLPADPLTGNRPGNGMIAKNPSSPSTGVNQSVQPPSGKPGSSSQTSATVSGGGSVKNSIKPQTQITSTPPVAGPKAQPQTTPAPTPAVAVTRPPQPTPQPPQPADQPNNTQTQQKSEDRKVRPRDDDTMARASNDDTNREVATSKRDRIANNRDRDEGNLRRDSRDYEDGDGRGTASRRDSEQIGPKLIQWSGRVNGEREVLIDLPGTPGTLEIPRVYRHRVGVIEPPSPSNRWRLARLRVFGDGGVSFVVRWWPMANQFTKLAGQ